MAQFCDLKLSSLDIIFSYRNCFLVTDAKDGQGIKLEKVGQTFSRFRAMAAKITEKTHIAGLPR